MKPAALIWCLAPMLALSIAGCSGPDPLAPPSIYYGEDACARCDMIISDARFAAAVIAEVEGRLAPLAFDDVGCLLAVERDPPGLIRMRYVADFTSRGWLRVDEAVFVHSSAIESPMATGVAACADRSQAEQVRRERGGEILDPPGLRARYLAGTLRIDPGGARGARAGTAGAADTP